MRLKKYIIKRLIFFLMTIIYVDQKEILSKPLFFFQKKEKHVLNECGKLKKFPHLHWQQLINLYIKNGIALRRVRLDPDIEYS